jgi:hypothetical protein
MTKITALAQLMSKIGRSNRIKIKELGMIGRYQIAKVEKER